MTNLPTSEVSPEPPLERLWEFEARDKVEGWMTPVAAQGMVFFGCKDGLVYALEATTGQEKWKFKMSKRLRAPLIVANAVFAASDDKCLYAIKSQTGEKLWHFSTGQDILYRPIVTRGTVYVVTKDKHIYALDAQTGVERWRYSTGNDLSAPEVGQNIIFLGSEDQYVYALHVDSGAKMWQFKSGHKKHSQAAIGKDKVLISGDDDLHAININDGSLSWVAKKVNYGWHTPIVEGDLVLCTKELTILNLSDGSTLAKMAPGTTVSNITVREGLLYASTGGIIFAIDLSSKQLRWYAVIEPQSTLHLKFASGKDFVFVTGDSYKKLLAAISTTRLMKRWESAEPQQAAFDEVTAPVVTKDMIIVSRGKKVSAFGSSKASASKSLLEIGNDVAPSPKYSAVVLLAKEGFLGGKGQIFWPNRCCLCGGATEKTVDLMKDIDGKRLSAPGIPYCINCYQKTTTRGIFKKAEENPGVEIARVSPPTFLFRNEKYWAAFMEVNRTR